MTYGEIEFLDEPGAPSGGDVAGSPGGPSRSLATVSVLGWLAAAVLAVLAPFRAVYSFRVANVRGTDFSRATAGVDGWGRSMLPGAGFTGPRFGLALVVCAAVFAALALVYGLRMLGRTNSPLRRVGAAASVGAPCLLVGVIGALVLYVHAVTAPPPRSSGIISVSQTGWTSSAPLNLQTSGAAFPGYIYSIGGCLWLALGAAGCAVAAALASLLRDRWATQDGPGMNFALLG